MKPLQKKTVLKNLENLATKGIGRAQVKAFMEWLDRFMRSHGLNKEMLKGTDQRRLTAFAAGYIVGYDARRSEPVVDKEEEVKSDKTL